MRSFLKPACAFAAAVLAIAGTAGNANAVYVVDAGTFGGSVYHVVGADAAGTGISWFDSEAYAVSLGHHLVTVNSGAENDFLYDTFGIENYGNGNTYGLWIGFTDQDVEGTFTWTSGEPVTYTNWSSGEPNNSQGNEDWARLRGESAPQDRKWNDLPGTARDRVYGVVEFPVAAVSPADASFFSSPDTNVLNLDFGSIVIEDSVAPISFDVFNRATGGPQGLLDLASFSGSGDTGVLTTDLATFDNLNPGDSSSFNAFLDTSTTGSFSSSYVLSLTDELGTAQDITLNLTGAVVLPDFSSNASFSTGSDQDVLNIDFGTVAFDSSVAPIDFDIANLLSAGTTADLDLLSIVGSGDTSILTTDLTVFEDLLAGTSLSFDAMIDTSVPATYNTSYDLTFTDFLGTIQTLTLNLSGVVEIVDDPAIPDLIYNAATGEVILDPDASAIIGYTLQNDSNGFLPGNFTPILVGVLGRPHFGIGRSGSFARRRFHWLRPSNRHEHHRAVGVLKCQHGQHRSRRATGPLRSDCHRLARS